MRRRDVLKLAASSAAIAKFNTACDRHSTNLVRENSISSIPVPSATKLIVSQVVVDWTTQQAQTTPFTFGSNDYEITNPKAAKDSIYQSRLANLGIGLIRICYADLCDRWTNPVTRTWDQTKIAAGYAASYPQRPTIVQNISGWPKWMTLNENGLLHPSEYDRYADFCAELVEILTQRLSLSQVRYWEPFNEKDIAYKKAGKLDELWKIYNKVAKAMKARNPQIQVGGPALNWDDTDSLATFLQVCGPNVDFISWHRYASGNAKDSTDKLMSYTPQYKVQVEKFRQVAERYISNRRVPLLLGEYNINYLWNSGEQRQNTHVGAVWFASVLKHLADAGIEMAASWHLKDGIYGMIDPQNNLRPAATVFAWGLKYLTGKVMRAESDHPFLEAMAVLQADGQRTLLLINKSATIATISVRATHNTALPDNLPLFSLDANGVQSNTLATATLEQRPLSLNPYSLVLLRFP